jgi:hypothetical protein
MDTLARAIPPRDTVNERNFALQNGGGPAGKRTDFGSNFGPVKMFVWVQICIVPPLGIRFTIP